MINTPPLQSKWKQYKDADQRIKSVCQNCAMEYYTCEKCGNPILGGAPYTVPAPFSSRDTRRSSLVCETCWYDLENYVNKWLGK